MDPKKDEEISIDFSKIKNFFKRGKKEETKYQEHAPKEENKEAGKKSDEDLDISIDFGKIKNFFKSGDKNKAVSTPNSDDEGISIDWKKAAGFFKKYGIVFVVLIPIILSIYVRMLAGQLLFADDWAGNSVISNIRSQIKSGIDQQYPNLPDSSKSALVDKELDKVINQNKQQIDKQIKDTSAYIKSFFQDESGKNYMPDIDPYYWFRYVKNEIEHGYPGDILKDGRSFDNHQLAPSGRFITADIFHIHFLAYFYRALHFFAPGLTVMRSMFYYPVFVIALCVLLVFLIAKKISGSLGGFFAGMIMAINAAVLGRTLFGHADSDAWVVFFPLIITWLFAATIGAKSTIKVVLLMTIAGFLSGLYAVSWSGWWHIFDFILATIAITFLYLAFVKFKNIKNNIGTLFLDTEIKNIIIAGLVFFASTAVFAAFFIGWTEFESSLLGPLTFSTIKAPVTPSLWPNVLTTVAELNEGSINGIINSMGGNFFFFISLMGLILSISRKGKLKVFDLIYIISSAVFYLGYFLFVKAGFDIPVSGLIIWIVLPIAIRISIFIYKKEEDYDFKLSILLALWMISTIYASIKGIRFTLLLAPAFSVAFGVTLGKSYLYLSELLSKELKIHKAIGNGVLIVLLLLVYVNPVNNPIKGAINVARSDIPIVNDAWYNTLAFINQNSSKDAIITSWWDFGHHFKALADRGVTFDGTTQTAQPAHWVGKLLMTDNEEQAMGIIRMLDCGGIKVFDMLNNISNDTHLSIRILNNIILLNREDAMKALRELKFNEEEIKNILLRTHCQPPEGYFIASEDMIGKSGVWSHFGSWNFERADIWQNARKMPQEDAVDYMIKRFNYTKERAENIYFEMQSIATDSEANSWIAPWPGYGGSISCSKNDKGVYICSNGMQVNLSNHDVFGIGQQGIVRPKVAVFTTEEGVLRKEFNGTTMDFGVTLIPKSESEIEGVLSSKELAGGMFTRMFYMKGHGLKYFKLVNHQRGLTGTNIFTYKLDWDGENSTIVQDYIDYLKPLKEEKQESSMNITNESSMNITNNSISNTSIS